MVNNLSANAQDLRGLGRSLEEEMTTLSRILVWRIAWTEEPGGPQTTRSQRVGYN